MTAAVLVHSNASIRCRFFRRLRRYGHANSRPTRARARRLLQRQEAEDSQDAIWRTTGHRTGPSSSPTSSFSFNVNFDLFRSHHYRGSGLFLLREETPQLHNKIASTQAERSVLSKGKSRSIDLGQLAGAIAQRPERTFHKYAHIRLRTSQSRSLRLNCWIHL